jgi:hypothetical protein
MANLKHMNKIHTLVSFSYRNNSPSVNAHLQSFETGEWGMCVSIHALCLGDDCANGLKAKFVGTLNL